MWIETGNMFYRWTIVKKGEIPQGLSPKKDIEVRISIFDPFKNLRMYQSQGFCLNKLPDI